MQSFTIAGRLTHPCRSRQCRHCPRALARRHKQCAGAALDACPPRADRIAMPTCSVQLPPATPRPRINRQRLAILALGLVIACLGVPERVHAQSSPPATAEAPSERAKRDADNVYELIRMHADKPRKATAVTTPATTSQPLPQASVLTPQPGNGASAVLTAAVAAAFRVRGTACHAGR